MHSYVHIRMHESMLQPKPLNGNGHYRNRHVGPIMIAGTELVSNAANLYSANALAQNDGTSHHSVRLVA